MSAFASPSGTDRSIMGSTNTAGGPTSSAIPTLRVAPLTTDEGPAASRGRACSISMTQAAYGFSTQQQQQQQQHQRRPSTQPSSCILGAPKGTTAPRPPIGVDGPVDAFLGASSTGPANGGAEGPSSNFASAAVRLLWGGICADEQHAQLDSPGRAPFLGGGPWAFRMGAPLYKAVYEENRNAFSIGDTSEWIPIPRSLSHMLCRCGAIEGSSNGNSNANCCCRSVPPHGLIPELNRLWVADKGDLFLWEVGAPEEAVERLSFPGAVECVVYVHLDRAVLPPALRASFCWDDAALSAFSVTSHLDSSGCTDTPPFADVPSSPLHCLAVAITSSVRLFAVSATPRVPRVDPARQHQAGDPMKGPSVSSIDYTEIGAAEKPKGGAIGAALELRHATAHRGSGLAFFGSPQTQQVYVLDVKPIDYEMRGPRWGSLNIPLLFTKRSRTSEVTDTQTAAATEEDSAALRVVAPPNGMEGSGFRVWGSGGFVVCHLAPVNPKLTDVIKWGFRALCSSFGLIGNSSNVTGNMVVEMECRQGLRQLQTDEARGIVWALGGDSSVTAFVIPPPNLKEQQIRTTNQVKNLRTLHLTCKEIEDGLQRVASTWSKSPPEGRGGLLASLRRLGGFRAVSLSVVAPFEGNSLVAVLTDAVGGRTYLSIRGLRAFGGLPYALPPFFHASTHMPAGPLRLEVRGYRGPIDSLPPFLGSLRCSAVSSGVFVSAYAAKPNAPGEKAVDKGGFKGVLNTSSQPLQRCAPCRSSCYEGAPCVAEASFAEGEDCLGGGLGAQGAGGYHSGNSGVTAICCCCKSRPVAAENTQGSALAAAAADGGSDTLVVAAPDLRALALLQQGNSTSTGGTAAAAATDTSTFGGYLFPSVRPQSALGSAGVPILGPRNGGGSSSSGFPSLCTEWFLCMRLGRGAGRVLLISEPFTSPLFGVLQQSSTIWPSPFDIRKRRQWLSLPYSIDPFAAAAAERLPGKQTRMGDGTGNNNSNGSNHNKKQSSLLGFLPSVRPPCAQSDAAAGALCGAPKLLILTSKFVLQLRRQAITQIYLAGIESLLREGSKGPFGSSSNKMQPLNAERPAYPEAYSNNTQTHQNFQHQQQQNRTMLVSVGPQRNAPWRLGYLLAEHMCEDAQFGADAMYAVFWQLLADSASSLAAFHAAQSNIGSSGNQSIPDGSSSTTNLLDKQLGALRLNKGAYFQPPNTIQLSQGGSSGVASLGSFETPFGLGYIECSERQQQQQQQVNATVTRGTSGGNASNVGLPSAAAAATGRGEEKAAAVAVAWRMLTALEVRRDTTTNLNAELLGEQLLLPVVMQQTMQQSPQTVQQQQPQQAWGARAFGHHGQQQHQQGMSQETGAPFQPHGFSAASQIGGAFGNSLGASVQGLPVGLSSTVRGLILYASRLLRPVVGTPLVEAALLPCGLARAESHERHKRKQQIPGQLSSRKRGREFEWQQEDPDGTLQQRGSSVCLVGRFSAESVSRLLYKVASLYEVLDAVYTTLFFSFGQRASLQQQQQQMSRAPAWGFQSRGLPPHFAALRSSGSSFQEGTQTPSPIELEQQDIIWGSIPVGDAVELSVLYGTSRVLVTASEMLTAYQLLMQQAEYSLQMGTNRYVSSRLFDSLLSLTLTDLKDELEAQMLYIQLQRKLQEGVENQTTPSLEQVQQFVYQQLMPRLLFLPLEGIVSLLDSLGFYSLLVDVVTAKAADLSAHFSRFTAGRRPKWPSLSADSAHQLADIQNTLVSSCYRHVGECLARYCKIFDEEDPAAPSAREEPSEKVDEAGAASDAHQDSKACAAALVNACLASNDEFLHNYVLDWIANNGGKNFPIALLQIDGPMADRLLARSDAAFAIDLGERYAASGLYAQAAKCHSLQGLRQWSGNRRGNIPQESSTGNSEQQQVIEAESPVDGSDVSSLLAFDAETDAFCCNLTKPAWHFLVFWLKAHSQEPSLNKRLLHFVKAKENVQHYLQQASGHTEQAIYSSVAKSENDYLIKWDSLLGDRASAGLDSSADGLAITAGDNSLKQIDLNIRMVGLQQALVRDAAHLFCVLTVNHLQSVKRERALVSGISPAAQAVSAEDVETFCDEISTLTVTGPPDKCGQPYSCRDCCLSILSLLVDLQRLVYAPLELLDLLTTHMNEYGLSERITPHFPSIAALRLYGQRVSIATARNIGNVGVCAEEENTARTALDDACMAVLSFAEASSRTLKQPRILSDALKHLMALPDAAVRESCDRSLKRLCVVLHIHAHSRWDDGEVAMVNAEGETVQIPGFLWPAWCLAECGKSYSSLIDLYLSFEQDDVAKQHSHLNSAELQTIFCWIFEQWLTSQDDVATAFTYVGLLHQLTESGDLPYFGSPISVPLWSQLNEQERARADVAAQQLTDMLLQIELAMASATRVMESLKSDRHFVGVHSRLAVIKQQVAEYRAALHKQTLQQRFSTRF
ncbi:hypothetical protein, conserved [Eimeria tenella]|uniref:Uncharacterized protein n=1 Tax=Eimeria tenella TaxID=5802 RepID=U6KR01_EIMTE|nr:hypothetical protein, conserved [Eimeria tenella]CDJ39363.1 hypothetical protein, conserved [Eimeria tenella]|eukprot:XP_013230118.1 hypothetical protein, conserved [Eimeria tenella]